jgi:hypothetical protein
MNSMRYYRERAAHYRDAAEQTDDPSLREQFDMLSDDYDELALGLKRRPGDLEGRPIGRKH